ncbi:MAG: TldD/PmbA family protein [Alistipes sp.]|nr:TldD/PmbA family protein [Candidatus Minthomonas equi]
MTDYFIKLFNTSKEDIDKVITAALSSGGDFADIFFEHTAVNSLVLRDCQVNAVSSDIDYGVGIRVVKGDKTGYAYSETTELNDMLRAARFAASIGNWHSATDKVHLPSTATPDRGSHNFYPALQPWSETSVALKKNALMLLNERTFSLDSRVIKLIGYLTDQETHILYANSLGESFEDFRPLGSLRATVIMQDGERTENFHASKSFRQGFEFINNALVENLAEETVKGCSFLFNASQPSPGQTSVVLAAGGGGILLHEAIGHAFEADFNRKNVSIFSEKMGHRICRPGINIVDDGTLPGNRGSLNIDDEGVPAEKTYMVKDGVLNSYLHDRISASFYGVSPTGNGRRESFRYMPIPRMRATYMENGDMDEESIIRSVRKGIYVDSFSNGQVQIGAGDFTFFVKSGYLIEDGHLTRPVKDCNIIGNGPQALADMSAVADNLKMENSTWTCGKGQHVPVCCGMPTVLINNLNVGGIN